MLTFQLEFEKEQDLESFRKKTKTKKNSGEVRELFKQKGDSFEVEKELVWCEISPLSLYDKIIAYSRGNFLKNFL